jgi:hypothetical protein
MSAADPCEPPRAWARGLLADEAGVELLIGNGSFLSRRDFRDRFVRHSPRTAGSSQETASIDWQDLIAALDAGELPCSGGERRVLALSASLAGGIPVDLRDAVTGLDDRNIQLLITAIRRASGKHRAGDIHDRL